VRKVRKAGSVTGVSSRREPLLSKQRSVAATSSRDPAFSEKKKKARGAGKTRTLSARLHPSFSIRGRRAASSGKECA